MTTTRERRLAGVEAEVDKISPRPSAMDELIKAHPWFEWVDCDELTEMERIYREADDDVDRMSPADQARVMAIMYASQARMLAGEPKDIDRPQQPCDIKAEYEKGRR